MTPISKLPQGSFFALGLFSVKKKIYIAVCQTTYRQISADKMNSRCPHSVVLQDRKLGFGVCFPVQKSGSDPGSLLNHNVCNWAKYFCFKLGALQSPLQFVSPSYVQLTFCDTIPIVLTLDQPSISDLKF